MKCRGGQRTLAMATIRHGETPPPPFKACPAHRNGDRHGGPESGNWKRWPIRGSCPPQYTILYQLRSLPGLPLLTTGGSCSACSCARLPAAFLAPSFFLLEADRSLTSGGFPLFSDCDAESSWSSCLDRSCSTVTSNSRFSCLKISVVLAMRFPDRFEMLNDEC